MTFCANCKIDVSMVTEITEKGLQSFCPTCHFKPAPEEAGAPQAAPVVAPPPRAVPLPAGATLVDHVRARLSAIELELARFVGLKAEEKQLRAMLRAAERKR